MNRTRLPALMGMLVFLVWIGPPGAAAQGQVRESLRAVSYFPLAPQAYWEYEQQGATCGGACRWRVEVVGDAAPTPVAGAFGLKGYFPGPVRKVRSLPLGVVTEVRPDGGRDGLWYMLRAPEGLGWTLELADDPANGGGSSCIDGSWVRVASRNETVRVPAGEFRDVVKLEFRSRCVDAGITAEWFAPNVGLVRREEATIAGVLVSELVETNAGGGFPLPLPYSTALILDRAVAVNDLMPPVDPARLPVLKGALSVRNDSRLPIELVFGGCKKVLVEVTNAEDEVVLQARFDDGGCCDCRCAVPVRLHRSGLVMPFSLPLVHEGGRPLADGAYCVTATFETLEPKPLRPRASARIEVKSVH